MLEISNPPLKAVWSIGTIESSNDTGTALANSIEIVNIIRGYGKEKVKSSRTM
jgi:hypothetical protein